MRLPDHIREAQNDVFDQQVHLCGLLAAAFHAKHGGVKMRFQDLADGTGIHEAGFAPPETPVEPHVWKARADEYRRVCDIPPEECMVVTRYMPGGHGEVGFERKRIVLPALMAGDQ
jgi:hypothetical protein